MTNQTSASRKRIHTYSIIQQLYAWACRRLYYEFAWSYDVVSWVVSGGRWHIWRGSALEHISGHGVLELGFGTGELLLQMREHGLDVYGVDLSPAMHRIAQNKLQRTSIPKTTNLDSLSATSQVSLTLANANSLPFGDDSFDTIVSTFPAPYILEPATISECNRVLSTGGRIVIVGVWVNPRSVGWLQHLPVFFGAPNTAQQQALLEPFHQSGFSAWIETFHDRWADLPIIIAEKV